MAIRDLLWCCPLCGVIEGIQKQGRGEACGACGCGYRRGDGASVVAIKDGSPIARQPREWLDSLPYPDIDGEGDVMPPGVEPPYRDAVIGRIARGFVPVMRRRETLGWREHYGPETAAGDRPPHPESRRPRRPVRHRGGL